MFTITPNNSTSENDTDPKNTAGQYERGHTPLQFAVQDVQKLRQATGAGMMAAKKALVEAKGDFAAAVAILRKKGSQIAAGKLNRAASQGIIEAYIHAGGRIGALVELACETDFVARTEQFKTLAHDIAMQVTAANPLYLSPDDIPPSVIEYEKNIYRDQLVAEGKTEPIIEKIINGKLQKYYQENCLLNQLFFKDDKKTVADVLTETIAAVGENIKIKRFARFTLFHNPSICSIKE